MTNTEKSSAIKRLNERLTDMARTFGVNSPIYKEYLNSIKLAVGSENMHKSPQTKPKKGQKKLTAANMGVPLITRGKTTYDALDDETIEALLEHHTAGQVKREIAKEAEMESKESGRTVYYEEVLETWENVYEAINDTPDEFYDAMATYWNYAGKGSQKPTYALIEEILDSRAQATHDYKFGLKEEAYETRVRLKKRITDFAAKTLERYFS